VNSTMNTIDAMHDSRVRSARPQVGQGLLAVTWGAVQGSSVSAATLVDARVGGYAHVPAFGVGDFGGAGIASTPDVSFQPFGEPPV